MQNSFKIVQDELKNELAPIGPIAIIRFIIVIYLSFLNCGRLLIREVQWLYWTLELLVPAEKFTVRMPMIYDVFFPSTLQKNYTSSPFVEKTQFSSEYPKIMHSFKFRFAAF